jgi:CRP-like cAMP-binding protein
MGISANRISSMPRFSCVSEKTLQDVADQFTERRFKKGELVIRQGSPSDTFLIIAQGYLKWERSGPHAASSLLDVYGPCETPGELALRFKGSYPASAFALTPLSIFCLSRSAYHQLLLLEPRFVENTTHCLSDRAHSLLGRIESAAMPDVHHQLGAFVYRLALKFGAPSRDGEWKIPFTLARQDFAHAANCRRETVIRTLSSWTRSGSFTIEDNNMTLAADFFSLLEETCGPRDTYFGTECNRCKKRCDAVP